MAHTSGIIRAMVELGHVTAQVMCTLIGRIRVNVSGIIRSMAELGHVTVQVMLSLIAFTPAIELNLESHECILLGI